MDGRAVKNIKISEKDFLKTQMNDTRKKEPVDHRTIIALTRKITWHNKPYHLERLTGFLPLLGNHLVMN